MVKDALAVSVTLRDPKTHDLVSFAVGDRPPKWAKDQITNPAAWSAPAKPAQRRGRRSAPRVPATPGTGETEGSVDSGSGDDAAEAADASGEVQEPPRTGKGSGIAAWREYADLVGVEYDEDTSKDDLIAMVDAAKADQQ